MATICKHHQHKAGLPRIELERGARGSGGNARSTKLNSEHVDECRPEVCRGEASEPNADGVFVSISHCKRPW